ncbi:MAG: leucine-rich repeat protein [Bacteroidales bacterium]|jgi:hypothetical protein|nr:leucine-rich repeat protein [Bacteroidales bacterium]
MKTIYQNSFRNAWMALLFGAIFFAACRKENREEPKSAACDILSFSVGGEAWTINGATIARACPAGTTATPAAPAITLSPGAPVNPPATAAQNFFTAEGVAYTVTAEDGKTTKTYTARATIDPATGCDILSFSVDGEAWTIDGANIAREYPSGTAATSLTPVITLSPGATVNPPPGEAQDFFTDEGVAYTVTAEDGATTKTYVAKATIQVTVVASGTIGGWTWTITGNPGNCTLTISGTGATTDYDFYANNDVPWSAYRNDIKTAIVQEGITAIGNESFSRCPNLTSVTIPGSVASIGEWAFYNCTGLTSVTIPNSVQTIDDYAFYGCEGLTSMTIPGSVSVISDYAFAYCTGMTGITIPNSVVTISDGAFYGCDRLTAVTIPNSVTAIGDLVFGSCGGLTSVTIPNSVETIGTGLFMNCRALTSAPIPNSVSVIRENTFYGCSSLTSVVIPGTIVTVESWAFQNCTGLTSMTIPGSVTTIGRNVFWGCVALTTVTNLNPAPQVLTSGVFTSVPLNAATLRVPPGSVDDYRNATGWENFNNIEAIP